MDKQIDKAYDLILIATIAVCFISAIVFMGSATLDTLNGFRGVRSQIWNALICVGMGIVVSSFFVYVKSIGGK